MTKQKQPQTDDKDEANTKKKLFSKTLTAVVVFFTSLLGVLVAYAGISTWEGVKERAQNAARDEVKRILDQDSLEHLHDQALVDSYYVRLLAVNADGKSPSSQFWHSLNRELDRVFRVLLAPSTDLGTFKRCLALLEQKSSPEFFRDYERDLIALSSGAGSYALAKDLARKRTLTIGFLQTAHHKPAAAAIRALISDEQQPEDVRIAAIRFAKELPDRLAVPVLEEVAAGGKSDLQWAALRAVARLKPSGAQVERTVQEAERNADSGLSSDVDEIANAMQLIVEIDDYDWLLSEPRAQLVARILAAFFESGLALGRRDEYRSFEWTESQFTLTHPEVQRTYWPIPREMLTSRVGKIVEHLFQRAAAKDDREKVIKMLSAMQTVSRVHAVLSDDASIRLSGGMRLTRGAVSEADRLQVIGYGPAEMPKRGRVNDPELREPEFSPGTGVVELYSAEMAGIASIMARWADSSGDVHEGQVMDLEGSIAFRVGGVLVRSGGRFYTD